MKLLIALISAALFLIAPEVYSRDTKLLPSIQEALQSPKLMDRLDSEIPLYFGDQKYPDVVRSFGKFTSNKKTNAFNKEDKEACQWVLLSALLSLQDRAKKEGANAVINIVSYYKKNIYNSSSQFECHAGAIMAGVALRGEVVRVAK